MHRAAKSTPSWPPLIVFLCCAYEPLGHTIGPNPHPNVECTKLFAACLVFTVPLYDRDPTVTWL